MRNILSKWHFELKKKKKRGQSFSETIHIVKVIVCSIRINGERKHSLSRLGQHQHIKGWREYSGDTHTPQKQNPNLPKYTDRGQDQH